MDKLALIKKNIEQMSFSIPACDANSHILLRGVIAEVEFMLRNISEKKDAARNNRGIVFLKNGNRIGVMCGLMGMATHQQRCTVADSLGISDWTHYMIVDATKYIPESDRYAFIGMDREGKNWLSFLHNCEDDKYYVVEGDSDININEMKYNEKKEPGKETILNITGRSANVCPVCGGKGIVPNGFYTSLVDGYCSSSIVPEKCRSCEGTGVVWG